MPPWYKPPNEMYPTTTMTQATTKPASSDASSLMHGVSPYMKAVMAAVALALFGYLG